MKRVIGLDIVRVLAIFFVISVHYFMNTYFYEMNLNSYYNIILLFFRFLFYTCVPLFLILTGYLARKSEFTKEYYYKIFRVLISYFIITLIVLAFRILYLDDIHGKATIIYSIFSFSANPYAWYVEMYVGLFLLIPFLNIIYNNINKRQKQILIITMIALTSIASLTNSLVIKGTAVNIIADYWITIYPITYFFIGKYLYEFPLKSKKKLFRFGFIILLIQTFVVFIQSFHGKMQWDLFGGYGNFCTLLLAVVIFSLLYDTDIKNKLVKKTITTISKVSFEMYLLSYIFDKVVYQVIKLPFNGTLNYLTNYLIYVPIVFILTFITAYFINKLVNCLYSKFKPVYNKICNLIKNKALKKI